MNQAQHKIEPVDCSICGRKIPICPITGWRHGNNAEPVNNGRCCDHCNASVVIPRRITELEKRYSE